MRAALALLVIAALTAGGILLYVQERDTRQVKRVTGAAATADRIDINVTAQRTDAAAQQVIARVQVLPQGRYAGSSSQEASQDLTVRTTSVDRALLRFPAYQPITVETVPFAAEDGAISDYPFDHYTAEIGFQAQVAGKDVPVRLTFRDADPFFVLRTAFSLDAGGVVYQNERISRSRGTFFLAWFMMAAMWALALAVLCAAWLVVAQRRGLVWPALGWMAATLFALVGMRNAAPGSPPIGSLLDYAAFFWAEVLIAASLVYLAFHGIRVDHARGHPHDTTPPATPVPGTGPRPPRPRVRTRPSRRLPPQGRSR